MPKTAKISIQESVFCRGEEILRDLLKPLVAATEMLSEAATTRCHTAGLIPLNMVHFLEGFIFTVKSVVAAQRAQRVYGVPCSYLIGSAIHESCWNADALCGGVDEWFLERARLLAVTPKFSRAMALADDAKVYAMKLRDLGFKDDLYCRDIIGWIEDYGLDQCDAAAILPPSRFSRDIFEVCHDAAGRLQLKPAFDLRDLRATVNDAISATT